MCDLPVRHVDAASGEEHGHQAAKSADAQVGFLTGPKDEISPLPLLVISGGALGLIAATVLAEPNAAPAGVFPIDAGTCLP